MVLAVCMAVACGQGGKGAQGVDSPGSIRKFPTVTPPTMMQDQQEILQFMVMHFWDAFMEPAEGTRCDSLHIAGVEAGEVEQNLANYIYLLDMMPMPQARKAVAALADKAEANEAADTTSNIFEKFASLTEKYLFDPNSPLRNEDYFQAYAERLSLSPRLDAATKDRYAYIAATSRINAVGTKAADFVFSDKNGRERNLYGIKADHILLFFSNPGCDACMEIINGLRNDAKVNQMIKDGALAVLNIYIDEDIQAWRDYMEIYPQTWYNGFDPYLAIRNDMLYNVRAIPSLYLLDSDKIVILKDAVPEKVSAILNKL